MKHLSILLIALFLINCKSEEKKVETAPIKEEIPAEVIQENAEKGKKWLEKSIVGHFSNDNPPMIMMTTPEYYEFKIDALNADLGLPGSITKEEFTAKWKEKFDLTRQDIFDGYLIPAQDFGKIKVGSLNFDSHKGDTLIYNVEINDTEFNANYKSIIHLIPVEKGFLIADQINIK
jgi:hypothetical protein